MDRKDEPFRWPETVIYQIYPRSFQDSNGDGIGDIPGILSRLDHLSRLGVESLWLSPVYRSPQRDFGYDISDYRDIAPEYGTLADLDRLIREVHRRDMKLIMDMVLNHSSDEHPWFIESASSRDNPRRDWYVWRDGRDPDREHPAGRRPPNNWQSQVTGPGWHRHPATDQWYWASFLPFQPDLNWRNPQVKEEMFRVLRFWLDRGVDGFRLDILGSVYEDPEFRNNPGTWKPFSSSGDDALLFRTSKYTKNHPDNFTLARELRELCDSYAQPRFLVGEVFGPGATIRRYCGGENPDGLNTVFYFRPAESPFTAKETRKILAEIEDAFPPPFIPCLAFSNHDRTRRFSVLGKRDDKYRLSLMFQLTARVIPCLYYGEETGMPQAELSIKRSLDAVTGNFRGVPAPLLQFINSKVHGSVFRDECRTPMLWNRQENGGFCPPGTVPWLPAAGGEDPPGFRRDVQSQEADKLSLLQYCRRLLELRRSRPALRRGRLLPAGTPKPGQPPAENFPGPAADFPPEILAYIRQTEDDQVLVLLNMSSRNLKFRWDDQGWEILMVSSPEAALAIRKGRLPGWTGLIAAPRGEA